MALDAFVTHTSSQQAAGSLTWAGGSWCHPDDLPSGRLLAFQAEQGHASLVSKVPNGDYTGLVIHKAVQDVPNYTFYFFPILFHKLQFHKNIGSPSNKIIQLEQLK